MRSLTARSDLFSPATAEERPVAADRVTQIGIILVVFLAVTYNAWLAFLGTRGFPLSNPIVVKTELAVLALAAVLVLRSGIGRQDGPSVLLAYAFFMLTLYVSLVNGFFFPDAMRNVVIISLFTMLGLRASRETVVRCFTILTALVLAVLLIEAISVPAYVGLFHPARYYELTRDMPMVTFDDSGLFGNALGFEGRFTFGVLAHRASSIFLEQVSFANYGAVVIIYLLSLWRHLSPGQRAFQVIAVVAILVTNSTRLSLVLALLAPIGYFVYPRLPRYANFLIAPAVVLLAWVIADPNAHSFSDDFVGRLTLTINTLRALDLQAIFGMEAAKASEFADSGYTYLIYASTIFGLVALWTFVAGFTPQNSMEQRRCAYALCVFVASALVVGGNAIYTIKIAAPLWLLIGQMRKFAPASEPAPATAAPTVTALKPVRLDRRPAI